MESQEIEINDALSELGVTKFELPSSSILQITIGDYLLTVDIDKKVQKTLENFEKAAQSIDFDAGILAKLKHVVAKDYPRYLQLKEESKDKEKDSNKEKDKDQSSSAVKAVYMAINFCDDLFLDNLGQPYAAIKVGNHIEVIPLKSEKFKDWLSDSYFGLTVAEAKKKKENSKKKSNHESIEQDIEPIGEILSSEALIRIIRVLKARAAYSGKPRRDLYLRVAKVGDTIYYDLVNSQWQVVKITSEGWDIIHSPILFRRYPHQREQVMPEAGATVDTFDEFLKLLNISDDAENKLLFKCYIVTLFYYGIVHAALMLHGESGAAKTAKQEMLKKIVDPSEVLTISISYDTENMAQKIAHNYVCFFDNISKIPDIIQDLLCRAITGTGFMKRELFTNDEEIIYKVKHALGLTGVNLAATKSDLIDRGLIIEHKPIKNSKRMIVIENKFEELRPKLLGHIFDILVKVLKYEKEHPKGLELENYPRLADFTEVGEIVSRCMGNKNMVFVEAFRKNIDTRHRKIIDDSPVGQTLEIFVKDQSRGTWNNGVWIGTMAELLPILREIARDDLQLESLKNNKYWPQLPNYLSRRINEINPSLRAIGIEVKNISGDNSNKVYSIKRNEKYPPVL